jgi:predicted kinase
VLAACLQATGDEAPQSLRAFYGSYRACVRAKVAALRAEQHTATDRDADLAIARRYLELADELAVPIGGRHVLVVRGLMGVGKSTLARALAESLGDVLLQTDAVRRELFGPAQTAAEFGAGNYTHERVQQVYRELFQRAQAALTAGQSVILDGSFTSPAQREEARALAKRSNAALLDVHCHCPEDVARQRIAARLQAGKDPSEARPDLVSRQREQEQPEPDQARTLELDTTLPADQQQSAVLRRLSEGLGWEAL